MSYEHAFAHWMARYGFALMVFVSFLAPVPLLAWLDRPRKK